LGASHDSKKMNIPRHNNSWTSSKSIFWGCLALFGSFFVVCSLIYLVPQLLNDIQLETFSSHLYEYPLPPNSEVVSQHAEVGLMGNGNHCDFLVEQTIITHLSKAEIETYYENVTFPLTCLNFYTQLE